MARVSLSDTEREFIRDRIARFEVEVTGPMRSQARYVAEHQALPLHVSWGDTVGITAEGVLVNWAEDGEWPGKREFSDAAWINIVLVAAARRYPPLQGLIPKRPADAITCPDCGGSGTPSWAEKLPEGVVCRCAGLGWAAP